METNFQRVRANDGIHDTITINEIEPECGWLEWYRRKDGLRDTVISAGLGMIYAALCTLAFYWG